MKNCLQIFCVFFLLLCIFETKAQVFYAQNSGTSANLMDVYFATDSIGWVVGEGGTILKTTNGGDTWVPQASNTTATLHALTFSDANNGWVVGANGTILKTANGGSTWQIINSPINAEFLGVTVSNNVVLACGACGLLLRSTDGGNSWTQTFKGTGFFYDIKATGSTVYAAGTNGSYISSPNSGASWSANPSTLSGVTIIRDMDVIGSNFYGITDDGKFCRIINASSVLIDATTQFKTISTPTGSTFFAAGAGGKCFRSTNTGSTWQAITTNTTQTLFGSHFRTADTGWMVGLNGTILRFYGKAPVPPMVWVEGGTFTMGCTEEQKDLVCNNNEKPLRRVQVSSFYIGKYEVTQGEWIAMWGTNPSYTQYGGIGNNYPVNSVSWYDALVYCNRLSEQEGLVPYYYSDVSLTQVYGKSGNSWSLPNTGTVHIKTSSKGYRLPTEAEWEYAARGGNMSKGYGYSGSNDLNRVGWYWDNAQVSYTPNYVGKGQHEVGQKQGNELGIYDMSGNVWEWCYDRISTYLPTPECNPTGPISGSARAIRGGYWFSPAGGCHVSFRNGHILGINDDSFGFRLCRPQ